MRLTGRGADVAAVMALAALIAAVIAAPVLRAPSDRIFGMPLAGHHHDPFTVMQQMTRPIAASLALQPATDLPGALIARAAGPVAAYNWLVLITFPLAAGAAYLLARHLLIPPVWAALAALAFAFSPFHLAQAAYHPHIAQVQWLPLYVLALWRAVDDPRPPALVLLALAAACVTFSNLYGAMIAAVITPPALAGYWAIARQQPGAVRRTAHTAAALALVTAAGVVSIWSFEPVVAKEAFAGDLIRYAAGWKSYVLPPVAHPLAGALSARLWYDAGVDAGLLEQQLSVGWGILALAAGGLATGFLRAGAATTRAAVPALALMAAVAVYFSLAPEALSAFHQRVPMFRAFARFGVIVQLAAALLAAIGAERLWRIGSRRARGACLALIALAAAEYAVWPPAMSRPALPTAAHRWAARTPEAARVLDCAPASAEAAAIQWLTAGRVSQYREPIGDCTEPNVAEKLAAGGFTHVIVRRDSIEGRRLAAGRAPAGLQRAAHFDDSDVFAIAAPAPAVHTVSMAGFLPREHDAAWTWRWMRGDASWWIANNTDAPVTASLSLELLSFAPAQPMTVLVDGREVQRVLVTGTKGVYEVGPFALTPGGHEIVFRAGAAPLSVCFGGWQWHAAARVRP